MLAQKIALNSLFSSIGRITATFLALVALGLMTRYLGQAGYGWYATILAFLQIFSIIANLGLQPICLREISQSESEERKIINNAFALRFFLGIFIFVLGCLLFWFLPYPKEAKIGILIGAIGVWFLSNNQILVSIFQKYLAMEKIALGEVVGRLIQLILTYIFIQYDLGFLALVWAMTLGCLANFGIVFVFARQYVKLNFEFDFKYWQELIKESLPLGIAVILTMIYFKLDTVMLSLMRSANEVGLYNLAYKILESLIFFPSMFVGLIMPSLSKYAVIDLEKFKKISQKALEVLLIFVIPLIIGVFLLGVKIILLIGGSEFVLSVGALNILMIAVGFIFLGALFSQMIIALKAQKSLAYIYGTGAVFNIVLNLIFIPRYGYMGAAGTTVATEFLVTALMLFIIVQKLKRFFSFRIAIKCLLAGLLMALALKPFLAWNLLFLIILGVFVYFASLHWLGGFTTQEILSLIRPEIKSRQ